MQLIYSNEVSIFLNIITGSNAAMVPSWHAFNFSVPNDDCTVTRRLATGIRSEKCVIRGYICRANNTECTYTNLDSTVQGDSNMTGTDLCVNKPQCAAAVRP